MKNQKIKNLSLMLASVLGAAALTGGALAMQAASADTATSEKTYGVSDVFGTSNASSTGTDVVAFDIKEGGKVTLKRRDLALKWYEGKGQAKYLTVDIAFADTAFEKVSVVIEAASAEATEDKKATNEVVFTKVGEKVYASVNDGEAEEGVEVNVANPVSIALSEGAEYGEYAVKVNGEAVGNFENIGATFGEYASSSTTAPLTPFSIVADLPEDAAKDAKTTVKVLSINGQSFTLTDGRISDNAVPVLAVNDYVSGFTLGTTFALDYEVIDVLDTEVTNKMEYHKYNPTVTEGKEEYKKLTTSTPFNETNYIKTVGGEEVETSVFNEKGKEFVCIRFNLSDDSNKEDSEGKTIGAGVTSYFLSWYGASEAPDGRTTDYIVIDDNKIGAKYTFLDTASGENKVIDQDAIDNYQTLVEKAAEKLTAGSKTTYYLPSLRGLITDDNDPYESLKFTIVYKSSNVTSETTKSALSASNLGFTVSKSGIYEFKVLVNDKAGNVMKYYLDGKEVSVTSSNVWKIKEIPYFTFEIKNTELSIEDGDSANDRKDSVTVGSTYDDFDLNVLGDSASTATIDSKLYRINFDAYNLANPDATATRDDLKAVTYDDIKTAAKGRLSEANGDYEAFFQKIYAEKVAEEIAERTGNTVDVAKLLDDETGIFVEIREYNDAVEDDLNNPYEWKASEQSFTAAETGDYLILAVYSDPLIGSLKACGYKLITVESEDDVIPGETEWLKNNIVSVVLFSIAGLMAIAIIIIAFVKPTDETLEDVDVAAKKTAKSKKDKK